MIHNTAYGQGLLPDQEEEARNDLLELDAEIERLMVKKKGLLEKIRKADLARSSQADSMRLKI